MDNYKRWSGFRTLINGARQIQDDAMEAASAWDTDDNERAIETLKSIAADCDTLKMQAERAAIQLAESLTRA